MSLKGKMEPVTLYHGSPEIVSCPKYGKGKSYNDYGLGFYCTEELDLAKEWAVDENVDGYANKYLLDTSGLKILDLTKTANVLNWITILLKNRVFSLKNSVTVQGKQFLIEHYSLPTEEYYVIKGYRADDSYFAYAESFLNNTISVADCSKGVKDLYLDKVKGEVTEDMFIELSKELYREKADLEALLQDEKAKLDSIEARIKSGDNRRELIQRFVNANHLTREMTDVLIDHIDVGRRIQGTHEVPIVIHWKFYVNVRRIQAEKKA